MASIHPYSRQLIDNFVKNKFIDLAQAYNITIAMSEETILKALDSIMVFNTEKIWKYLIESHWKQYDDVFDSPEMLVFKIVVINKGLVIKENIKLIPINITRYQLNKAIESLQEQEMLFSLIIYDEKYPDKDPIIVIGLHPQLLRKINGK